MAYSEKLARQSNGWYNDGLTKAQIRDLSGAQESLERAIEYDRTNIQARNLLGLIYYGRGQTGEAIAQWIDGADRYELQGFVDRDTVPFAGLEACSREEMEHFADIVRPHVKTVELRGV